MDIKIAVLYFFLGGTVVVLTSYFGSMGKGFWAVFTAFFPAFTVVTFLFIHFSGGEKALIDYVRWLLYLTPAWVLYIFVFGYFVSRKGVYWSLVIGILVFIIASLLTRKIVTFILK